MQRVLTKALEAFVHRRMALPIRVAVCVAAFSVSPLATAQASVLVEACNGLKSAAKRAQCLKQAGVTKASNSATTSTSTNSKVEVVVPFTLDVAVTACESVMKGLVKRHAEAVEDTAESNDQVFAVTWPGLDGKAGHHCAVDRQTRRIVSIGKGDKAVSGERLAKVLAEAEATTKILDEIKTGNYASFILQAKTALAADFKDPSSAQYRSLFLSGATMPVLCGEVNAKNSYGAYVGFRRFYATGKPLLNSVEKAASDYVFEQMWPSMCGEKKAEINA